MGTTIKIKCIDQTLKYEGTPTVASGGVNEDYVEFEFNTLWDGFSKVAVFYQNKGEIYYSLVSTDNTAVIPKEVIAKKGIMYLGVLGVKGNVTMTSQVLQYHIESGALDGFTPEEPTQEIYQQILAELQSIRDLSAETLSNEQAFEKAITERQESYETDLTKQWGDYETDLNGQWSTYKTNLTQQQTDYESKITNQQTAYETKITKQQTDYETKINSEFDEYKVKVPTIASDKATEVVNAKMGDYVAKTDIIDNLTSTNTDKPLSANQGKTLKGLIDTLDDKSLKYLGQFKGDFSSTSIPSGIYTISQMTTTCTNYPTDANDNWGLFIQYPNSHKTQIIEFDHERFVRKYSGSPLTWQTWESSLPVDNLTSTTTLKSLSANQGKVLKGLVDAKSKINFVTINMTNKTFSAYARSSVSQTFTVPSGTLIGAMHVNFNGATGFCANGVSVSGSTCTVWVNNLDNSSKTVAIQVVLVYVA